MTGTGYVSFAFGFTITIEQVDDTGAVLRFEPTSKSTTSDTGTGSQGLSLWSD